MAEAPGLPEVDTNGYIPVEYLTRLLVDQKNDILIVDDHDQYNMTIVLAAMRGSFEAIWTSRCDRLQVNPRQRLLDNVETTVKYAKDLGFAHNRSKCGMCSQGRSFKWTTALRIELKDPSIEQDNWDKYNLNFVANQLSDRCPASVPKSLIWLSFPWLKYANRVAPYIQKFLFDCSQEQNVGDRVLISLMGSNPHNKFDECYELANLISFSVRLGYAHFVEPTFIKENCVHYGFHHRTYKRKYDAEDESDMDWVATPFSELHVFIKVKAADANVSVYEIKLHDLETNPPRP